MDSRTHKSSIRLNQNRWMSFIHRIIFRAGIVQLNVLRTVGSFGTSRQKCSGIGDVGVLVVIMTMIIGGGGDAYFSPPTSMVNKGMETNLPEKKAVNGRQTRHTAPQCERVINAAVFVRRFVDVRTVRVQIESLIQMRHYV